MQQLTPRQAIESLVELSHDARQHHPWLTSRLLVKASKLSSVVGDLDHSVRSISMLLEASDLELQRGRLFRSRRLLQLAVNQSQLCPLRDDHRLKLASSRRNEFRRVHDAIKNQRDQLDADLFSQLCHCFEVLDDCRFQSISMLDSTPSDTNNTINSRKREKQAHLTCRLISISIKARHLLDQALTRFMHRCIADPRGESILQASFPLTGSRDRLVSRLNDTLRQNGITDITIDQSFPEVIDAMAAIQPFSMIQQPESSWFERVYRMSNKAKHSGIDIPSSLEIDQWFAASSSSSSSAREVGEWPVEIEIDGQFWPWLFIDECSNSTDPESESRSIIEQLQNKSILCQKKKTSNTEKVNDWYREGGIERIEQEIKKALAPAPSSSNNNNNKAKEGASTHQAQAVPHRDDDSIVSRITRHIEHRRGARRNTRLESGVDLMSRSLEGIERLMRLMARQQPLPPPTTTSTTTTSVSSMSS